MELNEAIGRISEIHKRLVRTETFRGFHSLTVGFTGLLGIVAAFVQGNCIERPIEHIGDYLTLWVGAALVNLVVIGAELAYRWMSTDSPLKQRLTVQAIQQFSPCLAAGGLFTGIIVTCAPEAVWILPGLWAVFFSLGVFACCRLLPSSVAWVGAYYMLAGAICLIAGRGEYVLSPWLMAGTFGIGQWLAAGILSYSLERDHEQI